MKRDNQHSLEISSVFSYFLAAKARELVNANTRGISIIPTRDFPKGAPIHEDGSTVYDPRKPRAYFAVRITTDEAFETWRALEAEFDEMRNAA